MVTNWCSTWSPGLTFGAEFVATGASANGKGPEAPVRRVHVYTTVLGVRRGVAPGSGVHDRVVYKRTANLYTTGLLQPSGV